MTGSTGASRTLVFDAFEYLADDSFAPVQMHFEGDEVTGWSVYRNGAPWLELGPGYTALQTVACGVCATDLDRRFLPFRLPQITGHEVLAIDKDGQRVVLEINASLRARSVPRSCVDCDAGLSRHCVERLVLGIHDLPGGFGPYVLAPVDALVPVPDHVPDATAVLAEPFAAAWRAVERIAPRAGDHVAVLGPRRLGMLVIAALDAWRRSTGLDIEITALVRRDELASTARELGADNVLNTATDSIPEAAFDVVVDTSANPKAFELACSLATREVHLKSTHGQPAGGLEQTTAMVVDEITIAPMHAALLPKPGDRVAWLSRHEVPNAWSRAAHVTVERDTSRASLAALAARIGTRSGGCVTGADIVVVDDMPSVDIALRPDPNHEHGLVRPCGKIVRYSDDNRDAQGGSTVAVALSRNVQISSSRCGNFRSAMTHVAADRKLQQLGQRLVTHDLSSDQMREAFDVARSAHCLKAVVHHARANALDTTPPRGA